MKNELDTRFVLNVYEKMRQHGKAEQDPQLGQVYALEGLKAHTDFDGYTVFISDAKVSLRLGFHNQYHFDYDSDSDLENFQRKLKQVDSSY